MEDNMLLHQSGYTSDAWNLIQALLKVLKAPTDKEAKRYTVPLFNELNKSFAYNQETPACIVQIQKECYARSTESLADALNIIRMNHYYTPWKDEWRKEQSFKELCILPILLPPLSLYPLSGYYLLSLIHGKQINLFDFDELYQSSLTNDDRNNNKSHRFGTFKKNLAKKLGDDILPYMTQNNEYAKQLAPAYEYCKELYEEFTPAATQSSPLNLLDTDGILIKNNFLNFDLSQKIFLFFNTFIYTMLSPEIQAFMLLSTIKIEGLLENVGIKTLVPFFDDYFSSSMKKLKRLIKFYTKQENNPCIYIYCSLLYKQLAYEYEKYKHYIQMLQSSVTPELCSLYLAATVNYPPIGWRKNFGSFRLHELTPEEAQNCNKCTWTQFYESSKELIDSLFPDFSAKDGKRLWNIARKAFIYFYPVRFDFDIHEKIPKTPKETWYEAHHINSRMRLDELIPLMHLINTLKDENAKAFWVPSYPHRHSTDTFGTMVTNIGKHPYPPFIKTLIFLCNLTQNIFSKGPVYQLAATLAFCNKYKIKYTKNTVMNIINDKSSSKITTDGFAKKQSCLEK